MTSEVVQYAADLAAAFREKDARATHDLAGVELPCLLVEPTPRREYDHLCGGSNATWTVAAVAPGGGGLEDVEVLEDLLEVATVVLAERGQYPETVDPANYVLPGLDPKPALLIRFTTENT